MAIGLNPCKDNKADCGCTPQSCNYSVSAVDKNKPCVAGITRPTFVPYTVTITRRDGIVRNPPTAPPGQFTVKIHGNPGGFVVISESLSVQDLYPNLISKVDFYPDTSYDFDIDCSKPNTILSFDAPLIKSYSIVINFSITAIRLGILAQSPTSATLDNGQAAIKYLNPNDVTLLLPGLFASVLSNGDGTNLQENRSITFHFPAVIGGLPPRELAPAVDITKNFVLNYCGGVSQVKDFGSVAA